MSLTLHEVEHIAQLARLELTAEEKERYRQQLSSILAYMAQLQHVDTAAIPPTANVLFTESVLRPDVPHTGLTPQQLFRNAPDAAQDQFRVPPVLE